MTFLSFSYFVSFSRAFLLTLLIEILASYPFAWKIPASKVFKAVFLANTFSLPIVWFIIPLLVNTHLSYVFLAEFFAFLSESLILKAQLPLSYRRCFIASLTMNLISFLFGLAFPFLIAAS